MSGNPGSGSPAGKKWSSILRKIGVTGGICAGMVLALLWLMGVFREKISEHAAGPPPTGLPAHVVTATVERMTVPVVESAVGTIRPVHETSVSAKILAKVVAVHVRAGQRVEAGAVLVELDDADLKARRDQAAAEVAAAQALRDQSRIEFERIDRLIRQGAAAQIEHDQATNALKAAEARLARAQQQLAEAETMLGYAVIRAPIAGLVVDKLVEVGDMARPGQPLLTMYDDTRMQLVARVREALAHRLKVEQKLLVDIEALNLRCQGTVSEVVPEAEAASRTFSVKVTGPCPEGVYPGMFGRLMIPLDEEQILVVPRDAVRRVGQLELVDVVEDGRVVRRAVQTGRQIDDKCQILSGLREAEQVIVHSARQG